jgi:hypothetical protein
VDGVAALVEAWVLLEVGLSLRSVQDDRLDDDR